MPFIKLISHSWGIGRGRQGDLVGSSVERALFAACPSAKSHLGPLVGAINKNKCSFNRLDRGGKGKGVRGLLKYALSILPLKITV